MFTADLRVLSTAVLTVNGRSPEPITSALLGADAVEFVAALRRPGGATPDPTSWLRRRRRVRPDGLDETVEIENVSDAALSATVRLVVAADLADMETVKLGHAVAAARPIPDGAGVRFTAGGIRPRRCPERARTSK